MNILALDISTKTGWAYFKDGKLDSYGTVFPDKFTGDFGDYPNNYVKLAEYLSKKVLLELASLTILELDAFIIEETNSSRQNYSQKILEYLHFCFVKELSKYGPSIKYVRTGEWRSATASKMSKEEKALNAKIARIKKKTGKKLAKIDGKVVGKKGRKHVALRVVKELFGLDLMRKEEDAADAILLGQGYLNGSPICDGTVKGGKREKI